MAKKFNDYYDHDNKVQYTPQNWRCPKCEKRIEVLSAVEVVHKCPSNQSKMTYFRKI